MKRKTRKVACSRAAAAEPSNGLADGTAAPFQRYTKANLDRLIADVELTIRDLPVWKNLVKRVGLRAARKILRQGYLISQLTDGDPHN